MSQNEKKAKLDAAAAVMKWCLTSEFAPRVNAALDLARSEPGVAIVPEEMDCNAWLFNCSNGTLDLKTGRLREHRREDYITKLCSVAFDPQATCPTWERFLWSVFRVALREGQVEEERTQATRGMIEFVQRLSGRFLTGDVGEQFLPIFWGIGANGKSTFVNALLEVLGHDYGMKANPDLLMASRGERHPTELAQLFGMRLVVASETHQGRRLNEALVKDLTGGEPIRARRMKEDFWQFLPTHKLILLTNHRPTVVGTDEGIWRRLALVPFENVFWNPDDPRLQGKNLPPELRQDKHLGDKLRAEYPGILAWMVRGCLDWQRDGLAMPERVRVATSEYREGEDVLQRWFEDRCLVDQGDTSLRRKGSELYANYRHWCEQTGETPLSRNDWGSAMTERGFERLLSNGTWYLGIALNHPEEGE
jgi:putative DNA primase/helicase